MIKNYQIIQSLKNIEHKYSTYLIDVVGVICDGKEPFYDAIKAINYLIKKNKQIIFLSNNPRPAWFIKKKLQTFGITENYHTVTSGDLLHHTLKTTLAGKKIYHLGRNRQHTLLEGTNAQITHSICDADAIILSCFVEGDENQTIFDKDLKEISNSNQPIYCPNPDRLALEGSILRYPSGYFAHKLAQRGCPIIYLGKPSRMIYEFITQIHPHLNFTHDTTLMIGDTVETDICGAINFGIDSLLVLSGITGLLTKNNILAIAQSPYQPTYIIERLL